MPECPDREHSKAELDDVVRFYGDPPPAIHRVFRGRRQVDSHRVLWCATDSGEGRWQVKPVLFLFGDLAPDPADVLRRYRPEGSRQEVQDHGRRDSSERIEG